VKRPKYLRIGIDTGWDIKMDYNPINFLDKLGMFTEHWSPRIIAQLNDYQIKLVKLQGEFV
jgi:hypothetical protein